LSLSAKFKACPIQRNAYAIDKLFAQIPPSDVKIIKDDFDWISVKVAAVYHFADGVEDYEQDNLKESSLSSPLLLISVLMLVCFPVI
jgi:hypothetical protein